MRIPPPLHMHKTAKLAVLDRHSSMGTLWTIRDHPSLWCHHHTHRQGFTYVHVLDFCLLLASASRKSLLVLFFRYCTTVVFIINCISLPSCSLFQERNSQGPIHTFLLICQELWFSSKGLLFQDLPKNGNPSHGPVCLSKQSMGSPWPSNQRSKQIFLVGLLLWGSARFLRHVSQKICFILL